MTMKLLIGHATRLGPVFIGQTADGRFHVIWKSDSLGGYDDVASAVNDAAGGHTFSPSDGADLGSLGVSGDVGDWVPAGDLIS